MRILTDIMNLIALALFVAFIVLLINGLSGGESGIILLVLESEL